MLEKRQKLWEHSLPQKRFECKTVTQANFPSVAWKTSMYILSPSLFYELLRSVLPFTLWIITELNKWIWFRWASSSKSLCPSVQFSSVIQSYPTLWTHESQYARPPCPSPSPGVHPDSRPSSQWCHPAISSSVVPFSSCPQPLPASESFPNESFPNESLSLLTPKFKQALYANFLFYPKYFSIIFIFI